MSKEYSAKELRQIEIIHAKYQQAINTEEIPLCLQIECTKGFLGIERTQARFPLLEESCSLTYWMSGNGQLAETANTLIGILCYYQQDRLQRTFGSGHLGDPIHLVLHQIKTWLREILSLHSKDENAKQVILPYINYIASLEEQTLFPPGEKHTLTMLWALGAVKKGLEDLLTEIDLEIENRSAREHFKSLQILGEAFISNTVKYLYGIFSSNNEQLTQCDIKTLRNPPVEKIQFTMESTAIGRILKQLLHTDAFLSIFPDSKDGNLIHLISDSQLITQQQGDLKIQMQDAFKEVKELGIIEAFNRPEALEDYLEALLSLHRFAHFLVICKQAYELAGEGGDLLIYGLAHTHLYGCIQAFYDLKQNFLYHIDRIHALAKAHYVNIIKEVSHIQSKKPWMNHYKLSDKFYSLFKDYLTQATVHVRALEDKVSVKTSQERFRKIQQLLTAFNQSAYSFVYGELPEEHLELLPIVKKSFDDKSIQIEEVKEVENDYIIPLDEFQREAEKDLLKGFQKLVRQRKEDLIKIDVKEWLAALKEFEDFPVSSEVRLAVEKGLAELMTLAWNPSIAQLIDTWEYTREKYLVTYHLKQVAYQLLHPEQKPDFLLPEVISLYQPEHFKQLLDEFERYVSRIKYEYKGLPQVNPLKEALTLILNYTMNPQVSGQNPEKTQRILEIIKPIYHYLTAYQTACLFLEDFIASFAKHSPEESYAAFLGWLNGLNKLVLTADYAGCLAQFKALEFTLIHQPDWMGNLSHPVMEFLTYAHQHKRFNEAWPDEIKNALDTMLFESAGKGYTGLVGILSGCCNVNINPFAGTPYLATHQAALEGHQTLLIYMKQWGADLKAVSENGSTLLHSAVVNRQVHLLDFLLEEGIDINAYTHHSSVEMEDKGWTALHIAVHMGYSKSVNVLLEKGASINLIAPYCKCYEPVLCTALRAEQYEIAKTLILLPDIDLNLQDYEGFTALHHAIDKGQLDMVHLLIAKGADLTLKTQAGESPWDLANRKGVLDIIEVLPMPDKGCGLM